MSKVYVTPVLSKTVYDASPDFVSTIPYNLKTIHAPEYWKDENRGIGRVVAVIDTGVDKNHPDLGENVIDGHNFVYYGGEKEFIDDYGHGTHVAGTIAALANTFGALGVGPDIKILGLKVLAGDGSGKMADITRAVCYACEWVGPSGEKVDVINMSLGTTTYPEELHDAVRCAVNEKGISVVVSAGNRGDGNNSTIEKQYPAAFTEVITVGAYDPYRDSVADFSSSHEGVDIIAPGVDVYSTYPEGRYSSMTGTSMATPHIAAILCLLKNEFVRLYGREASEQEIYDYLIARAVDLDLNPKGQGHGLVDLMKGRQYDSTHIVEMIVGSSSALIDSYPIAIKAAPIIHESRVMLGLRDIGDLFGFKVGWDNTNKKATLSKGYVTIDFYVGSTSAYRNRETVSLHVAPIIHEDRTMLGMRDVGELFNYTIHWDNTEKKITIKG